MSSAKHSKKLLFVLRHAPYGNSLAKESLDAVLATSAYDQDLSIIFIDDGVFQLIEAQNTEAIGEKNIIKILSAFPLYDIDALFVCRSSLQKRGLTAQHIPKNITILDDDDVTLLFKQQDHLLSF